jgi:hypothetical protein
MVTECAFEVKDLVRIDNDVDNPPADVQERRLRAPDTS